MGGSAENNWNLFSASKRNYQERTPDIGENISTSEKQKPRAEAWLHMRSEGMVRNAASQANEAIWKVFQGSPVWRQRKGQC